MKFSRVLLFAAVGALGLGALSAYLFSLQQALPTGLALAVGIVSLLCLAVAGYSFAQQPLTHRSVAGVAAALLCVPLLATAWMVNHSGSASFSSQVLLTSAPEEIPVPAPSSPGKTPLSAAPAGPTEAPAAPATPSPTPAAPATPEPGTTQEQLPEEGTDASSAGDSSPQETITPDASVDALPEVVDDSPALEEDPQDG